MTKEQNNEAALMCYRTLIDDLQGRVIYMEDEEGVLRRWIPPRRPIFDPIDEPEGK